MNGDNDEPAPDPIVTTPPAPPPPGDQTAALQVEVSVLRQNEGRLRIVIASVFFSAGIIILAIFNAPAVAYFGLLICMILVVWAINDLYKLNYTQRLNSWSSRVLKAIFGE